MARRWSSFLAGLTLVLAALAAATPAMAASSHHPASHHPASHLFHPGGLFRAAPGTHPVVVDGHPINFSNNWSGYAVTGQTFTTATADWTQNAVTCPGGTQDSSPWVGIDGYTSSTVEQTGTDGDCNSGKPSYYAWYEMFPRNTVVIHKPIQAGDKFTATVTHTGGTNYKLTLTNLTENWTNTVNKSITAKDNSAEAVMELDGNTLADFGTNPFSSFTVDGKAAGSYPSAHVWQMEIKIGSTLCDSTSALSGSENFSVTWLNQC